MKRGLIAMLALVLALGGCGGSDDSGGGGGGGVAGEAPASAAPSPGKGGTSGTVLPTPPPQSEATKRFGDCMREQGVELPSPSPTAAPGKRDTEKIMMALRTCMKAMSAPPSPG